ncbi:GAF domain-containing protein [Microbacterium sp. LWH13-1.2]|uniref:helix-turn-helix domain-containing protein n=1 Tax=Microbacterium sp. LWH13-1.2 TaxID=3135260 RepID=UPI0031398040
MLTYVCAHTLDCFLCLGGHSSVSSDLVTWLARLRELSEVASRGIPVGQALGLVAATARELLPLDFCGVLTPNEEKSALIITGWDGLSREYVDRINESNPVGLGSEAPSSRAYFGGVPVVVTDIEAERGFAPWGGIAHEQGYTSMISVPLRSDRGVLGTLNGYHAARHEYSADEIERMTLLANHAAVALSSADLVDDLRRSNDALLEQRDLLARSQAIREQLLQASLSSRGVEAVLSALQQIVRRPVTYVPLHDASDATPERRALARRLIQVEGERAGELVIWASAAEDSDDAELGSIEEVAARHAVAVLTLELLRQRTALDTEHRIAGELLQDVLLAGITEQSISRAQAMGFDLARLRVATVVSLRPVDPESSQAEKQLRRGALVRLGRLRVQGTDGLTRPLVTEHQGNIVALWPDDVGGDVGDAVHAHLSEAYPRSTVTVASSGAHRRTLAEAVRISIGAHALAASAVPGQSVRAPELGFAGLLLHVDDPDALHGFLTAVLGGILAYDAERGSNLIETLQQLISSDFDRSATARSMRVHVNTVQQRIRRMESLTGRSLASPGTLLDLTAALAVHSMLAGHRVGTPGG